MQRRFLVNPRHARRGLRAVEAWFRKRTGHFEAVQPKDRLDTIAETRRALREGVAQVVAVGGDGMVNAVANGFFDEGGAPVAPGAVLAVAPWGTGCDYFRSFGGGKDWKEIAIAGHVRETDVGRITSLPSGARTHFMNAASVGIGAEVVRRQKAMPGGIPALLSYAVPALATLVGFRAVPMAIALDGKRIDGAMLGGFFAKGTYLGGGMRFGGGVGVDDGRLDVTLLHGMGLWASLPRFGKIFTGNFAGDPKITKTTAAVIALSSPRKLPLEMDGELEGTTDATISVLRRAIRVAVP